MIINSGSIFYMIYGNVTIILFTIIAIFYKLLFSRNFDNFFSVKNYFLFFFLLSSFNYFFINSNHSNDIQFYLYFLLGISSWLVITTVTFKIFRKVYLDICFVLTTIAIVVFGLSELGMVSTSIISKGDRVFSVFLFNVLGWQNLFHRMAGIFWEPGAYQIVLFINLILYFDLLAKSKVSTSLLGKLLIIVLGIVFTQSSAGYMGLIIITLALIFANKSLVKKPFLRFVILVVGSFISILIYNSPVISEKLGQKDTEGTSYEIRKSDNLAMLQMVKDRPFTGYGIDSKDYQSKSAQLDNQTSSNGLLALSAKLGLPALFVFLLFSILNSLTNFSTKSTPFVIVLIVFIQLFEVYYYFPLSYVFMLPFKYIKIKKKIQKLD